MKFNINEDVIFEAKVAKVIRKDLTTQLYKIKCLNGGEEKWVAGRYIERYSRAVKEVLPTGLVYHSEENAIFEPFTTSIPLMVSTEAMAAWTAYWGGRNDV